MKAAAEISGLPPSTGELLISGDPWRLYRFLIWSVLRSTASVGGSVGCGGSGPSESGADPLRTCDTRLYDAGIAGTGGTTCWLALLAWLRAGLARAAEVGVGVLCPLSLRVDLPSASVAAALAGVFCMATSHRLSSIWSSISSKLDRERAELVAGATGGSSSRPGKTGVSSSDGEPRLSSQLPDERHEFEERDESMGDESDVLVLLPVVLVAIPVLSVELSLTLDADERAAGGAAMIKTSSEIRYNLGTGGTGGVSSVLLREELVDALAAADVADFERAMLVERVSDETLALELCEPCVGVLGILGVDGIEAYASMIGREGPEEKRSNARRLAHSSLGGTASVAVEREARWAVLLLARLDVEAAALGLPSESRRRMLRFDFFSAPAGSESVDEAKLCMSAVRSVSNEALWWLLWLLLWWVLRCQGTSSERQQQRCRDGKGKKIAVESLVVVMES